jgi:hypothetical protein
MGKGKSLFTDKRNKEDHMNAVKAACRRHRDMLLHAVVYYIVASQNTLTAFSPFSLLFVRSWKQQWIGTMKEAMGMCARLYFG